MSISRLTILFETDDHDPVQRHSMLMRIEQDHAISLTMPADSASGKDTLRHVPTPGLPVWTNRRILARSVHDLVWTKTAEQWTL